MVTGFQRAEYRRYICMCGRRWHAGRSGVLREGHKARCQNHRGGGRRCSRLLQTQKHLIYMLSY